MTIERGFFVLLCGASGCGKTTVTRAINGLIPHYYERTLEGSAVTAGLDVAHFSLFELSFKGCPFDKLIRHGTRNLCTEHRRSPRKTALIFYRRPRVMYYECTIKMSLLSVTHFR